MKTVTGVDTGNGTWNGLIGIMQREASVHFMLTGTLKLFFLLSSSNLNKITLSGIILSRGQRLSNAFSTKIQRANFQLKVQVCIINEVWVDLS